MGGKLLGWAVAMSISVMASSASAGGPGGFRGGGFRLPANRVAVGGPRGFGGGTWRGGARPLPPIAGVIHERSGYRPYYSPYGHVNTGERFGGFGRVQFGRVRFGRVERFADGRRRGVYRLARGYGGYGGEPYGFGNGGYGGADAYGGGYGVPGADGAPGTYGHYGTQAGVEGGAYLSEPPLAASRSEPPLAPSPYGPDGGYYAPRRSSVAPHILTVDRSSPASCGCRPSASAYPVIYRYGVGTAY